MRDSALKQPDPRSQQWPLLPVGEELMRDSALKLLASSRNAVARRVGEELMRDSALKPNAAPSSSETASSRRRAHARQRFETMPLTPATITS